MPLHRFGEDANLVPAEKTLPDPNLLRSLNWSGRPGNRNLSERWIRRASLAVEFSAGLRRMAQSFALGVPSVDAVVPTAVMSDVLGGVSLFPMGVRTAIGVELFDTSRSSSSLLY